MSFHLVAVNETAKPTQGTNFRPLRLGGPTGLIASYIKASGSAAESHWNIPEEELLELAGGQSGTDLVFFRPTKDQGPDGTMEIYRLGSLHGVASSHRTDVVCLFAPLRIREAEAGVWEIEPTRGQVLCESLSLSGGTSGGQWLWTDSPMTLGATVVGGAGCSGGCSGGCSDAPAKECCGSCH